MSAGDWRTDRIRSALEGRNPTVLAEVASGFAVMGDTQFLPGYCVLLGRDPEATALADLPRAERVQFLADVDLLATAVERACRDADSAFRRINLEVLGNTDAFVHAHVWPRYTWEGPRMVGRPVWLYDPSRWSESPLGPEHDALRASITRHLRASVAGDAVTR